MTAERIPGLDPVNVSKVILRACADPHAIVDALIDADDVTARRNLQEAFGFTDQEAGALMDQQIRQLLGSKRAEQETVAKHGPRIGLP